MSDNETTTQQTDTAPAATAANSKDRTFTNAEVEQIIKDRLDRQKRANDTAAVKAAEEARIKALAENNEWQKVAVEREAELNAAQQKLGELSRYEQALAAQLEREKVGLPQYILDLLSEKNVVDQLEYLAKHAKSLRQSSESPAPNLNGANKSAKPVVDAKARAEELQKRYPSLKIK